MRRLLTTLQVAGSKWDSISVEKRRTPTTGQPVKVQGLTAMTWEIDGRHGVSFRVDCLESAGGAPKTAQAA
jgi:hypothetical protein